MAIVRSDLSLGFGPQEFVCFAREETILVDVHLEQTQLQDGLKDQGGELVELNFSEEGKES